MTLKQLYLLNSAWDPNTILTVVCLFCEFPERLDTNGAKKMVCTFCEFPEHVQEANVVCFANARIIVRCDNGTIQNH